MQIKLDKYVLKKVFGITLIVVALFAYKSASALTITPVRLEIKGDPGQVLSEEVTLINDRDTAQTYYVTYANFEAQGETGTPNFVDAKDDIGTWMESLGTVVLAPNESKIIQIKISIPKTADPGGHFGAIFWGTQPPAAEANAVSIGAKTGLLVLLTVNGNVNEQGGILEFATKNKQTFYTSLPVNFYYRFQNSGDNRIKPAGDIVMKDMIGITAAKVPGNPVDGNILPKSIRKFETTWQGKDGAQEVLDKDKGGFFDNVKREWRNFAFGHYRAELSLAYGTKNEISTATYSLWVFPWHLTIFVIVLAIIIFIIGRWLIRRYNKWVIAQAEMMLKREQSQNQGMNQ